MAKLTKRAKVIREAIGDAHVERPVNEALDLLRKLASTKFNESIDVSVNLGIDARKSDQSVRGATVLPNGTGRVVRVAVFADGADAEAARAAGADIVGLDDLAARVKGGQIDFDVAIATPQTMRVVGQLGQILGPRGLMPNPKVGTVAADVAAAVRNAKAGQVQFRADKAGIVHCSIGKVTFDIQALTDNLEAVLADLIKARPSSAKGVYLKSVTLSSTMGPGIRVDKASLRHT